MDARAFDPTRRMAGQQLPCSHHPRHTATNQGRQAPARVCVVGVGYVGAHLAGVMAAQHDVIGYDVCPARVADLRREWAETPRLTATSTPGDAAGCDLYCICVPTPVVGHQAGTKTTTGALRTDLSCLEAAVATVTRLAQPGASIVIESSVSVGTTRRLLSHLRARGLFIGFSPERVDSGRVNPPARAVPKILAAVDDESLARLHALYAPVFDVVVPVSTLETAEMAKLAENCFRLINIAYVNEIADACSAHGIDPHEMVTACATKPYGYMPFTPGLGAGGPCIPVNPHYLLVNNELPLLERATKMNAQRPAALAASVAHKHAAASRILVSGIGFKPGEALTTHSPGLAFAHELKRLGRKVAVHDPVAGAGKADVDGLAVLDDAGWTAPSLAAAFDLVCVAMPQAGVDFGVLAGVGVPVEWLCAPVCQPARRVGHARVAPIPPKPKPAVATGQGRPVHVHVSAFGAQPPQ